MTKIRVLLLKYKSIVMYAIFGAMTTLVNLVTYYLCFNILGVLNVLSTVIAWVLAVAFAFVTNKVFVFDSKSFDGKTLRHEIPSYLCARIGTGLIDVGIMYLAVDVLNWNSTVWKVISNLIVIILNYVPINHTYLT